MIQSIYSSDTENFFSEDTQDDVYDIHEIARNGDYETLKNDLEKFPEEINSTNYVRTTFMFVDSNIRINLCSIFLPFTYSKERRYFTAHVPARILKSFPIS
jgi:hypothetical protein